MWAVPLFAFSLVKNKGKFRYRILILLSIYKLCAIIAFVTLNAGLDGDRDGCRLQKTQETAY